MINSNTYVGFHVIPQFLYAMMFVPRSLKTNGGKINISHTWYQTLVSACSYRRSSMPNSRNMTLCHWHPPFYR